MPRLTIAEPAFDKSRDRWKVTVPAGLSSTGNRIRSWHKTRDAARTYISDLTKPDQPAAIIAPQLAMKADEARAILEPWNMDIVQAAREVAAALEVLGTSGSILEAAKAYRASHDSKRASKPLGEAVALYLTSREDLRDATLRSYRYTLEKVLGNLHHHLLADITTAHLETILGPKGATARRMHRRNLGAFWKWACHENRGWATMGAVASLEAPRVSNDADIVILKPAEVKALMGAAEAEGHAAAAGYAIAVFGGVRMAELGKLTWANVGEEHIEIGKDVAKKHARRLVPICPALRAWLDVARGDAADDSKIVPSNWTDISKSVRRAAGWDVAARLLDNPPTPTRGAWPSNAPRHTCASVQVAIGTPLEKLTFAFGHSGGHDLLRKHYVSRLTKKDALAILAIGPNGSKVANIAAA